MEHGAGAVRRIDTLLPMTRPGAWVTSAVVFWARLSRNVSIAPRHELPARINIAARHAAAGLAGLGTPGSLRQLYVQAHAVCRMPWPWAVARCGAGVLTRTKQWSLAAGPGYSLAYIRPGRHLGCIRPPNSDRRSA